MTRRDDIEFRLGATTRAFEAGLNRSRRVALGLKSALAGIGAGISVAEIRRVVSEVGNIADQADKIGLTVEALQELRYAGEQAGVGVAQTDMAMQRFSRRVAEAAQGQGELVKILEANNVALRDQQGNMRPQIDILRDYAELIRNAGSEQEQLLLAFKAFDSEGAAFVNAMRDGADGLSEMSREARNLGIVLEEDTVRAAKELDDEFTRIIGSLTALWKGFVVTAADGARTLSQSFTGMVRSLTDPVAQETRRLAALRDELDWLQSGGFTGALAGLVSRPVEEVMAAIDQSQARLRQLRLDALESDRSLARINNAFSVPAGSAPTRIPGKADAEDEASRKRSAEAARRQAEAVRELIAELKAEHAALSMSAEQKRISEELRRHNIDVASEEGQAIAGLITMIEAEKAARERLDQVNRAEIERLEAQREAWKYLGDEALHSLESILNGSQTASEGMKDLAIQIGIAALKAALLGTGPMAALFPANGSMVSPAASQAIAAGMGGLYARGGISNRPAIFGEAGPEAAVPLPDGRSIPVRLDMRNMPAAGQAARNDAPAIHYAPVIDARGADAAVVARLERVIMDDRERFGRNVRAVSRDARLRNRAV